MEEIEINAGSDSVGSGPSEANGLLTSGAGYTLSGFDYLWGLTLSIITFLVYSFHAGVLEFFRHTEADRTLIAWEMVKTGDYLVPRILGDVILTKPPLFYWWSAFFIALIGEPTEFAARLGSLVSASVFVLVQFWFLLKAGATRLLATVGAVMLASGVGFFMLAGVAEIDMTFALVCSLAFYFTYFAILEESITKTLLAHFFAGLAFLAKGPPAICIFMAGALLFTIYRVITAIRDKRFRLLWRLILLGAGGSIVLWSMVMGWLVPVSHEVGWNYIVQQFNIEVVQRITEPGKSTRGYGYYLGSIITDCLPWCPIMFLGLILPFFSRHLCIYRSLFSNDNYRNLFVYSFAHILPGFVMMSVSAIKTNRYFFPYYGLLVTLTCLCLVNCYRANVAWRINWLIILLAIPVAIMGLCLPVFIYTHPYSLPGVSDVSMGVLSFLVGIIALLMVYFAKRNDLSRVFFTLVLLVVCARIGMVEVYAPWRNSIKSVKPIVAQIGRLVPAGAPIYSVRMFERWISYYLVRSGRTVIQDSTARFSNFQCQNGKIYLFYSKEDDYLLVKRIAGFLEGDNDKSKLLATFHVNGNEILLLEIDAQAFCETSIPS